MLPSRSMCAAPGRSPSLLQAYVAAENLFDYTQADSFGENFDTNYVYGPIHGRCIGLGLRLMARR